MSGLLALLPGVYGGRPVVPVDLLDRQDGGSASDTIRQVTFGPDVQPGDGVLLIASGASNSQPPATPSGFSLLDADTDGKTALFWRIVESPASGATYQVSYTGSASIIHRLHGYLLRGGVLSVAEAVVADHAIAESAQCGGTTFDLPRPGSLMIAAVSTVGNATRDFAFSNDFSRLRGVSDQMESAYRAYEAAAAGEGTLASWINATVTDSALVLIESQ